MNELKSKALELRKLGKTYNFIHKELGVAKSTLSYWFSKDETSKKVKEIGTSVVHLMAAKKLRQFNENRRESLIVTHETIKKEAVSQFAQYSFDRLFLTGLSIYLTMGDKNEKTSVIRLSSTDTRVLKIFLRFSAKYLDFPKEKVKFWPLVPQSTDIGEASAWWMGELGLTIDQFYTPQVNFTQKKPQKLLYGRGNIIIGSKLHKVKLLEWVKLLAENLVE